MSLVDLERKEQELEQLRMDCEHFRARLESVQADSVREKKVHGTVHALITWLSGTDHGTAHALMTWLFGH